MEDNKGFLRDIIISFLISMITMGLSLVCYGIISRSFAAEDGLVKYMLIKRIITFLVPCCMLGLPIALTRYLATVNDEISRHDYFIGSVIPLLLSHLLILFLIMYLPIEVGGYILGAYWNELKYPLYFTLISTSIYTQIYSYYRGKCDFIRANFLSVLNFGILPTILFIWFHNYKIADVLNILSSSIIVLTFAVYFMDNKNSNKKELNISEPKLKRIKDPMKKLLLYGLPRVPGFFLSGLLLTISTVLLAKENDVLGIKAVSTGLNVIFTASGLVAPIGIVLLPKGAQLISKGNDNELISMSKNLISLSICFGIFIVFQWIPFGDYILKLWLNFDNRDLINCVLIISCAMPLYMVFEILRNVLDAVTIKPVNVITQVISITILLVLYFLLNKVGIDKNYSSAISLAFSLCALGISTITFVYKYVKIRFSNSSLKKGIIIFLINSAFMVVSLILKAFIYSCIPIVRIVSILVLEILLMFIYILLLNKIKVSSVSMFINRLTALIKF